MSNKRIRLSIPQKLELIDEHSNGTLSQQELGDWAKNRFNLQAPLAQQTISNILKSAPKILKDRNIIKNGKSLKGPKYPELDSYIYQYVADMNKAHQPVNREGIKVFIKHIAKTKYNIQESDINFSDGWLTNVFHRLKLKSRPTHGESSSVDVTSENIQSEMRKIEAILKPYDPADIMNFDETGLYYQQPPKRTISFKPIGGLKKSKTRLTVGLLCNADGSYKGHPIVIGQHKSPRCFKTKADKFAKMAIGRPHYVEYHHSPTAWMTTAIFSGYIRRLDVAFGRQNRKVALLLDNASMHKVLGDLNNIKLIFLPANTTSRLQPLDAGTLMLSIK